MLNKYWYKINRGIQGVKSHMLNKERRNFHLCENGILDFYIETEKIHNKADC